MERTVKMDRVCLNGSFMWFSRTRPQQGRRNANIGFGGRKGEGP